MSHRVIACANCGARYKIPESFQGAKARCKSCSAVIEIASSIVDPAEAPPAPEKPAAKPTPKPAAKPEPKAAPAATARGRRASASRGSARPGRAAAGRRAAREESADEQAPARGRAGRGGRAAAGRGARGRGRAPEEGEKSNVPVFIGIGAGVIAVAVAAILLFGGNGDDQPKPEGGQPEVAKKDGGEEATQPDKVAKQGEQPADDKTAQAEATPAVGKTDESAKPEEATTKKPEEKTAKPEEKSEPGKVSPFDAKTLPELTFPSDVTEEEAKEYTTLGKLAVEDVGIQGKRATEKLGALGRRAFPALFNALREVDYMDFDQAMNAFMIHKEIEVMLLGNNVPYRPPQPGLPISQDDAYWNAKCLAALHRFWEQQVGSGEKAAWDAWEKLRKENLRKKEQGDGEDK